MRIDEHTLSVDQVRQGDHAFAHYADDEAQWTIVSAFTGRGCALGHKVIVVPDPATSREDASQRIRAGGGMAERALASGQVVCTSMREIIYPDTRFRADQQLLRFSGATEQARREGYAGLRLFVDMRWTHDLNLDVESMMAWETGAEELFTSGEFAAVCGYDRHAFDPEIVEAMRAAHPVALLERPGELRAYRTERGCHLIGDADAATRPEFRTVIEAALDGAAGASVLLDLSRICFLSVGCAADLLRLTRRSDYRWVVVRCSPFQARMLRQLDADSIATLVLDDAAGPT
jgi:anti-anti-sigma regulatory factor